MKNAICFLCLLLSGCDFLNDLTSFLEPKFKGKAYIVCSKTYESSYDRVKSELQSFGVTCSEFKYGNLSPMNQHRKIWQKIADSNETQAMILEDNVYFEKEFKQRLQQYIQDLPQDWDLAFLVIGRENNKYGYFISVGDIFRDIDEVRGHPCVAQIQKTNRVYGLYGYIVNKKGAKKLLKLTKSPSENISDIIFQKGGVNTGYIKAYVSMFKLLEPKLTKAEIKKIDKRTF